MSDRNEWPDLGTVITGIIFFALFWLIAPFQWLMDLGT